MTTERGHDIDSPIRRLRLPDQIASVLTRRIVTEDMPAGSQLPTEQDLIAEFGVGKSAVREAIRIVATKGLVEVIQGSGTRVAPRSRWNVIDPELLGLMHGRLLTMEHLIEVRRSIEPEIAELAAQRATVAQLEDLTRIVDDTVRDGDDRPAYVTHDLAFHDALAAATGNPLFTTLLGSLTDLLVESRRGLVRSLGARQRGVLHHERILEALRARDSALARARMVDHLRQVADDWHSQEVLAQELRDRGTEAG